MRTKGLVRYGLRGAFGVIVVVATTHSSALLGSHAVPSSQHSSYPLPEEARNVLNATHHHGEWVPIVVDGRTLLAAVTYPDRPDRAPVVVVAAAAERLTPWVRAVADQITDEGYIAVVPDAVASDRAGIAATVQQLAKHPAATGRTAMVTLGADLRIDSGTTSARFPLSKAAWSGAVNYLHSVTNNDAGKVVHMAGHGVHGEAPALHESGHPHHDPASQVRAAPDSSAAGARGAIGVMGAVAPAPGAGAAAGAPRGYPRGKLDTLPAGLFTAKTTVLRSSIRAEWVDIPTPGAYNGRMHTRITYPDGTAPAGIVVVMQHGPGMDDWMQALGDQLSRQGFIALIADLHTGMGPKGGNYESFAGPEDVFVANARLNPVTTLVAYEAVRQYGLKLPRANGKSAAFGFCMGGSNAWAMAMNAPDLSAAVVYYGAANGDEAALSKMAAPVIGFYGEDDARVTATVEKTAATLQKLGKAFEPHVYPHATHGFLEFQDLGGNPEATRDSWNRAIAFLQARLR
ncbi:MAG: dienelactone hydrolase family protein [Steroidobacteraceae bacterium]